MRIFDPKELALRSRIAMGILKAVTLQKYLCLDRGDTAKKLTKMVKRIEALVAYISCVIA